MLFYGSRGVSWYVNHSVSPSILFCPSNFTCRCSLHLLVWFKASEFISTINIGTSLALSLGYAVMLCVIEILPGWFCNTCPFRH